MMGTAVQYVSEETLMHVWLSAWPEWASLMGVGMYANVVPEMGFQVLKS